MSARTSAPPRTGLIGPAPQTAQSRRRAGVSEILALPGEPLEREQRVAQAAHHPFPSTPPPQTPVMRIRTSRARTRPDAAAAARGRRHPRRRCRPPCHRRRCPIPRCGCRRSRVRRRRIDACPHLRQVQVARSQVFTEDEGDLGLDTRLQETTDVDQVAIAVGHVVEEEPEVGLPTPNWAWTAADVRPIFRPTT